MEIEIYILETINDRDITTSTGTTKGSLHFFLNHKIHYVLE